MNTKNHFFKTNRVKFVLGAALLTTLTGCTTYVDRPNQGSVYVAPPPVVYVAPPAAETAVVVQDDYVYYPDYQVYYSSSRHQYAYLEGGAWVSRPAPRGVSINVLIASPSVKMNFHDAPANHHAEIVRQYPKNWRPPGSNQGQKENHNDDQHGDNNNGR
jgi:hypothetical protein